MKWLDTIICYPFGAVLKFIYGFLGSYGLAIIVFAILTKVILLPLTLKSKRSTMEMQDLQPQMKELQKKYADDKQKYQEEIGNLYKKEGVSPGTSCLSTFITLPIITGLYYVVVRPLTFFMGLSYDEIVTIAQRLSMAVPETPSALNTMEIAIASAMSGKMDLISDISEKIMTINFNFFGLQLGETPTWNSWLVILPILSCISAFILNRIVFTMQEKLNNGQKNPMQNSKLFFMMPLMSLWFAFMFPAGVVLYWITSNIVACVQEVLVTKMLLNEKNRKLDIKQKEEQIRAINKKEIIKKKKNTPQNANNKPITDNQSK